MEALNIVVTILQLLCGLVIILAVLFQSGKSEGLSGAIGGVADSFLAKNKARTIDAKLARATKWFGAVFLRGEGTLPQPRKKKQAKEVQSVKASVNEANEAKELEKT